MVFGKQNNIVDLQKVENLEAEVTKLKSAVEELTVLNDIARAAATALDLDKLLNIIVQKSIRATKAEQGSIVLVSPNKDSQLNTLIRREAKTGIMPSYKVGNYVIGWVLKNRKSLLIEDLSNDDRFQMDVEEKQEVKTVMCMPIWSKGVIIGVFTLTNKKNNEIFNSNDLRLLSIISGQSAQLISNLKLHEEVIEKERLQEELRVARNIQLSLLPKNDPETHYFDIASYFSPTDSVGGDYYDYFNLGDDRLGIIMADVSGHGPSAALIMTMLKGIIHSVISNYSTPDQTIIELNKIVCKIAPEEMFITLVLLIFDLKRGILQISNAGHHPVLHFKSETNELEILDIEGCALNLSVNSKFYMKEINFNKNDLVCIYTDGIVEAENKDYLLFGSERLIKSIEEVKMNSARKIISNIKSKLDDFTDREKQSDDIALIVIKAIK